MFNLFLEKNVLAHIQRKKEVECSIVVSFDKKIKWYFKFRMLDLWFGYIRIYEFQKKLR